MPKNKSDIVFNILIFICQHILLFEYHNTFDIYIIKWISQVYVMWIFF